MYVGVPPPTRLPRPAARSHTSPDKLLPYGAPTCRDRPLDRSSYHSSAHKWRCLSSDPQKNSLSYPTFNTSSSCCRPRVRCVGVGPCITSEEEQLCVHSLSSSTACVCVLYKSIITDHRSTRHALLIRLIFCVSCRKRPNNSRLVRASSFFFVKDSNNASWSFVPADFTNQWHSQFIWYASLMELEAKIHLPTSLS